ncbi:MAG: hypothetical protein ACLQME_03360 [Alphaproteobacteria bacterium]
MEFANFWLPIIGGGLLWAIAIGAWFSDHKIIGIWSFFAGTVILLFLFALQIQDNVRKGASDQADAAEKALRPWVSVREIRLGAPLVIKNGIPVITLLFDLNNTGRSPAMNVDIDRVYVYSKAPGEPNDILAEQKKGQLVR